MQRSTRSQKPGLEAGIETSARKKKVSKSDEVVEKSISRRECWVEVELGKEVHAPEVALEHRQKEDVGPSESIGEKEAETEEIEEENPIEVEEAEEVEVEPPAMMNLPSGGGRGPSSPSGGGGGSPPPQPGPPIHPLVRPRGLPIWVLQNLISLDMPSDLPKFYGTRDDNPSRHMERYIKRMTIALITDERYWLVWFPTTLDGEAYEWYRDHNAGHFMMWDQLLREFLTKYMSEVDQSTALRTLTVMRQREDESITAYIRRFDLVRSRFVGVTLNKDTLRHFFIQVFSKPATVIV